MSYKASIYHVTTGSFLMECLVEGPELREAEKVAIAKAALRARALPQEMEVRHLHQRAECRVI